MKNNRANSFRLHRISRANSTKKHSQSFFFSAQQTVKLPAMNSVSRGTKYNQLSFITGNDLNKLRVEPLETNDYFYQSAHSSLAQTRKKYDQMKKQRVSLDENIIKLKAQIKKYKTFEDEYQDKINQAKTSASNLQKGLQEKKLLLQQTIMQKKVLEHMRRRHRSDKVVYDQRKFNFQKEESFQKTQISLFKRDGYYVGEEFERTQKIYEKLLNQLNAQNIQREQHLKNLEDMIHEKDVSNKHNVTRQREIYQIAERALQDKDPNQKQWHQIYLTNVFVSKMLRNKIDREMDKFSVVEFAFKNIKTATGVSDAKTLIHKFLNKESQYGDLLGRITINEKKISELKQHRDFLFEQQKELQIERQTLQTMKIKNADISNEIKIFHSISQHERKMETYISKISFWLNKQAKKLNAIERSSITFQDSKSRSSIKNNFIQFCQILSNMLAKCDKADSDTATTVTDLSARDSARVARIQPKKSRKNSMGQQIFDVEEEQLPPANEHEQKEVINSQRQELVRTNEKFMRQARKRLEQKRKLGLQRVVEKKDKKVAEVKKQQD